MRILRLGGSAFGNPGRAHPWPDPIVRRDWIVICDESWTSCIALLSAMRFMADIAPERLGPVADG